MNTYSCGMKIWVLIISMHESKCKFVLNHHDFESTLYLLKYYFLRSFNVINCILLLIVTDYIFLHFSLNLRYIKLVKKYDLEISQPAITSETRLTWKVTQKRMNVEVHRY